MTTLLDWETPHLFSLASGFEANENSKNLQRGEKIVGQNQNTVWDDQAEIEGPS